MINADLVEQMCISCSEERRNYEPDAEESDISEVSGASDDSSDDDV